MHRDVQRMSREQTLLVSPTSISLVACALRKRDTSRMEGCNACFINLSKTWVGGGLYTQTKFVDRKKVVLLLLQSMKYLRVLMLSWSRGLHTQTKLVDRKKVVLLSCSAAAENKIPARFDVTMVATAEHPARVACGG